MQKFIFREQLKNRGCYFEFEFEVKFLEGTNCEVRFNYLADPQWELSCKMGCHIFKDYLFKKKSGHFEFTVHAVKWLPVDTNHLIVLFAIIKGLTEFFNLGLNNLELDAMNETFKIPELRSIY